MCGGMEFKLRRPQVGGLGLIEAEEETLRILFPNPKAAVPLGDGLWAPWGRHSEQPGDWPEGGWARAESLAKAYWTRWDPAELLLRPVRWMEKDPARKSHWFVLDGAIRAVRLLKAPGTPVYVVTIPSPPDFASIHPRMPQILQGVATAVQEG